MPCRCTPILSAHSPRSLTSRPPCADRGTAEDNRCGRWASGEKGHRQGDTGVHEHIRQRRVESEAQAGGAEPTGTQDHRTRRERVEPQGRGHGSRSTWSTARKGAGRKACEAQDRMNHDGGQQGASSEKRQRSGAEEQECSCRRQGGGRRGTCGARGGGKQYGLRCSSSREHLSTSTGAHGTRRDHDGSSREHARGIRDA